MVKKIDLEFLADFYVSSTLEYKNAVHMRRCRHDEIIYLVILTNLHIFNSPTLEYEKAFLEYLYFLHPVVYIAFKVL
jgi:hypothetical protein